MRSCDVLRLAVDHGVEDYWDYASAISKHTVHQQRAPSPSPHLTSNYL
jgi:hypothetical protein